MLLNPAREHEPIHGARHLHVRKHNIHPFPGCEDCGCLSRVWRFENYVASAPKMISDRQADENVIFDDQNGPFGRSGLLGHGLDLIIF
jgi:hypothetical protein